MSTKIRNLFFCGLSVAVLLGVMSLPAAAQRSTATLLGTVTDASGAVIPDAMVRATNDATGVVQTTTSDAQGRYRISDLPVGDYDIQSDKMGFQTLVKKNVTLSIGADVVVDFPLSVGQVSQTVTVEGEVSQVETTSASISNLVEQSQIRDLPLNGRNFEQLILLAPGVQTFSNISKGLYYGAGNAYSVSGSRANGQAELMDDTDVNDYMNRGSGAGVLGTSMGVDGIAEFQTLTNTYGAQFGGNGAVMNAVSKSGTNDFHGSAYEFFRNSALDARNFFDPAKITPYRRNQFGGTIGGPIKKDKMFFFANYEGLRQGLGETKVYTVLDADARNGTLPIANSNPAMVTCVSNGATIAPGGACPITANIANVLAFYNAHVPLPTNEILSSGAATGTGTIVETGNQPGTENYVLARYDWTISSNDTIFTRYLSDVADLTEPFAGAFNLWPSINRDHNQFATIEEKHIFSTNVINTAHFGYSRPLETSYTNVSYPQFQFYPAGSNLIDATISVSGVSSIGGATSVNPIRLMQNKYGYGDDVLWTKGAHTFKIGGSITRVQSGTLQQFPGGGSWSFNSLALFLQGSSSLFSGPIPGTSVQLYNADGTTKNKTVPGTYGQRDFRENQYAIYFQDDWKIRPTLTLNLGLRWEPTSNPWEQNNLLTALINTPYGPGSASCTPVGTATCSSLGTAIALGFSPVSNVYASNPSYHNFDPRIGIAWDPFKDHKTSIRAGYGIFHAVNVARDYAAGYYFTPPWATGQSLNPVFPVLNPATFGGAPTDLFGFSRYIKTTPYQQQWNLSVQREVMKNTVVTVSYVGSHGIHLLAPPDENPPVPDGVVNAIAPLSSGQELISAAASSLVCSSGTCAPGAPYVSGSFTYPSVVCTAGPCTLVSANGQAIHDAQSGQPVYSNLIQSTTGVNSLKQNNLLNPNFGVLDVAETVAWSKYNALQVGIVRRLTNNLQSQVSYTWSHCVDTESGSWTLDAGSIYSDPYNRDADRGLCSYDIRHNLIANALYTLPFHGNQLVTGWQVGGIFNYHSGTPVNLVDGFAQAYLNSSSAGSTYNRPNLVSGCNLVNSNLARGTGIFYINTACITLPAVGELGNLGRNVLIGPNSVDLDTSITKNTRINERINVQFRAEFFNILNNVNFSQPTTPIFAQAKSGTSITGLGTVAPNAGQITSTSTNSRQIQFGLKVQF